MKTNQQTILEAINRNDLAHPTVGLMVVGRLRRAVSLSRGEFDEAMLDLVQEGKAKLTPATDRSKLSREDDRDAIQGCGEVLAYFTVG